MLFNSYSFLLAFLPLTLLLFYGLLRWRGEGAAIGSLCLMSLGFYTWWEPANLPILLVSIGVNFVVARQMLKHQGAPRVWLFALGIAFNLLLLGYYKYAGFFTRTLAGFGADVQVLDIALPLAISFFTFQQISFLRGVYQSKDYVPSLLRYATFITFFPHLIAGPILHHKEIQPQFGALSRSVPWHHIRLGIAFFTLGLFKKVMIADPIGHLADPLFELAAQGEGLTLITAWLAPFLYGFQLYFDFSGYSDMAIGLAYLFGITFPQNFNSPYRAVNIQDFWRRWHITLSQFLRDFLYIPLGGNRCGAVRQCVNVLVTMGLGGLWHGANTTFLIWGLLHGAFLAIHAFWQRLRVPMPRTLAWGITFMAVMLAWVWFRASDVHAALYLYHSMVFGEFSLPNLEGFSMKRAIKWMVLGLLMVLLLPNSVAWVRESQPVLRFKGKAYGIFTQHSLWVLAIFALFIAAFLHVSRLSIFLYFNFLWRMKNSLLCGLVPFWVQHWR